MSSSYRPYHPNRSGRAIPKSNFGQMKRIINVAQLDIFKPYKVSKKQPESGKETGDAKLEGKTRRLKIQYGHYNNSLKRHPVIRLAGCWLRNFDFQIGDSVEVEITKGHISITKVPVKK